MNVGLLLVRVLLGAYLAAHGAQKLFGWFGGHGLAGTASWLESLGFRPGRLFAVASGLCEGVGGILVLLGFLQPIGSALIIVSMVVAALTVHWRNGFFVTQNGIEMPLAWATCAAAIAFAGSGRYALGAALGVWIHGGAWMVWGVLAGAVLIGLLTSLLRHPPVTEPGSAHA